MNELITQNGEKYEVAIEIANEYAFLKKQMEDIQGMLAKYNDKLLEEMRNKGVKRIENDVLTITYLEPTYRENFDKKAFKKDHQELYDQYVKTSEVKDMVRVNIK